MVSLDKAVITRISKGSKNFEILVDPDKALEYKKGSPISIDNILAVNEIFTDSKKGERASDADLQEAFGTTDKLKIAENIIKNGQLQLTTEQRRHILEEKKKQIADIIFKQAVDPKTKIPHPVTRILNAMDEVHVNIDPFKSANDQVEQIIDKLRTILPLSIEVIEVAIKVPIQHAGKASSAIRSISKVKSEEWKSEYWFVLVEIPAGMQSVIYEKINAITAGTADIKVMKKE
ncbi:MAG: ribosome assembly factor SBDS [Candidatus Aenigmatarchaeota archaeon]|nr:ribosome assembly factor SBDS [Nanoarchaeota archaeon]